MQLLAYKTSVSFDAVRSHALFVKESGDQSLRAMERAGLLQLQHHNTRPYAIFPGKPLHRAAFRHMMADTRLVGVMETRRLKKMLKYEEDKIKKYEQELKDISLIKQGVSNVEGATERTKTLGALLAISTQKANKFLAQIEEAKKMVT